jgi:hypothetical protein
MGFKQIFFDDITGEIMLVDENHNYLCDIYGDKVSSFKPNITGYCNYKQLIEHYSSDPNLTIEKNQLIGLIKNFKVEPKAYLPTIRKIEGYAHMPNPLINPFANINEIKEKNKYKLLDVLKKHYRSDKVKSYFSSSTNQGISYLTSPLKFDYSKIDRDKIIVKIDDFIEEYKIKNKYKLDLLKKDPLVVALRRFRKFLVLNENTSVIHGRKLPQPTQYITNKFQSNYNGMRKFNLKPKKDYKDDQKTKEGKNKFKNLFAKINKITDEGEDDLSYLSHESENEKIYKKNNILVVKSLDLIKKKQEKEDNFLQGFKSPPLKEEQILRKIGKKKFKTNGEFYIQSMDLLKKGKL